MQPSSVASAGGSAASWMREGCLALAPHFSLHAIAGGGFLLLSEERSVKLNDPFYGSILPLLDGRKSGAAIVGALTGPGKGDPSQAAAIERFLASMVEKGYAVPLPRWGATARAALHSAAGDNPGAVEDRLSAFTFAVLSLQEGGSAGGAAAGELSALLAGEGLTPAGRDAELTVVLVEDYLQPDLAELASDFAARQRAWVPFRPGGRRSLLGPRIAPFEPGGGCYRCLARRMGEHRPGDGVLTPPPRGTRPAKGWTAATLALAGARASIELAQHALGRRHELAGNLLAWPCDGEAREIHPVLAFPDCPDCGSAQDEAPPQPLRLDTGGRVQEADNGWRVLSTAEALQRLERIVSPLTGIVAAIKPLKLESGLHVFTASQGTAVHHDPRQNRSLGRPGSAAGKGVTEEQSRISCLAEAVERYACQWSGVARRSVARWPELGPAAPAPELLLGFSDRQYGERDRLNPALGPMNKIPERFRPDARIDWSQAWSLRDDSPRWLPTRYCYFDYRGEEGIEDHPFCHADSNGCAAGGSLEEAIFQGFLELVERDAVGLWWYNRLRRRAIDPAGLDDPFVARVEEFYARRGKRIHLLDLTTDLGVPVVAAISAGQAGEGILFGFGAHLDGRLAVLRALTELLQSVPFSEGTARRDSRQVGNDLWDWLERERLDGHPYLVPEAEEPLQAGDLPRPQFASLGQAVEHCVGLAAGAGLDVIVHDLSRKDLPLSCVRVVVPGLRHFWNRRGPGRLYEVPVKMGWLERPHAEDSLNPISFFL